MSKEGKSVKKAVTVVSVTGIIIIGLMLFYTGVWIFSDRIVRNTYNGLDNLFVGHDEYFAVAGPFHVMIPKFFAQSVFNQDVEEIGATDEEVGKKFFVQATYSKDEKPQFEGTRTIAHTYDPKYVITVKNPGPDDYDISADEERIMLEIAEHFYDFNRAYVRTDDNWLAGNDAHKTLLSYDVFFTYGKTFVAVDRPGKRTTLYSYDKGVFLRIMSVPDRGDFDVVMWK